MNKIFKHKNVLGSLNKKLVDEQIKVNDRVKKKS